MTNLEIAQLISERIGDEPIPFNSVHDLCEQIYNELGGDPAEFDNVYEILLRILPLIPSGSAVGYRYDPSYDSIAEGADTDFGTLSVASGARAHAEGIGTTASGMYSHAEGEGSVASGTGAHAEGCAYNNGTITAGDSGAHAEGFAYNNGTITAGDAGSHVEGLAYYGGSIYSIGNGSHAEGYAYDSGSIIAKGDGAHAEGHAEYYRKITASGDGAHAEGYGPVTAYNIAEHAQGFGNVSHNLGGTAIENFGSSVNTIHSIGIGGGARKNAVEIMQNGDMYLLGVGDYDGVHIKGETGATSTLKTLQEVIASLEARITALGG